MFDTVSPIISVCGYFNRLTYNIWTGELIESLKLQIHLLRVISSEIKLVVLGSISPLLCVGCTGPLWPHPGSARRDLESHS